MKYLLILLALLVAAPLALGAPADICDYLIGNISLEGKEVPGYVPYGNERVNVYDMQNRSVGHVATQDSVVTSASCETVEEPTYDVYVQDLATVDRIFYSDSPLSQLIDERRARNVRIEGTTPGKRVKNSLAMGLAKALGWFGL